MDFSAPHISSCSLLIHVTCAVSSQDSFLDPFDHLHWSLFSNRQFTQVSNHTALFGMNKLPPTLHVPYQSGASSSPSSSPSPGSDFGVKPSFYQNLPLHSHLSAAQSHLPDYDHSVFGSHWRP